MHEEKIDASVNDAISPNPSEILNAICRQNPKAFKGLSKQKREEIAREFITILVRGKDHSGPIPSPETLAHYDDVIANGAERIIAMAESEQKFGHKYAEIQQKRLMNQSGRGQIFGFVIAFSGVVGGVFLSYHNKETVGLTTIVSSIVLLVGAFIGGRMNEYKRKE